MDSRSHLTTTQLLLVVAVSCFATVAAASEDKQPDFSQMKAIDHANRIYSDGINNYLVVFENYYQKEVSAYVKVPKLLPGYSFISHQCVLDDNQDDKITAFVKIDLTEERRKDVRYAWIVDTATSSIVSVEPVRVYCFNDAWGI
jgi:hypothetical protein